MKPRTVLITGAAGLLGSRLAEWIATNEPNTIVVGLDDFSGGYVSNLNFWYGDGIFPNTRFYQTDMYSLDEMNLLFKEFEPDVVYHFAAYAAEGLSPFIRGYNYINNLYATSNVVTCCIEHNVKRIVFTSSMAVYGNQTPPFNEDMARRPVDPYGVAKAACEADIEIAWEQHGLEYCIIRPHNVYGRGQNISDSYRNVLGIWMYRHLQGEPITIFGDGLQTRAFSSIEDSLEPMWKACYIPEAKNQIINLGGIYEYTIKEAAETLADVMGGADIQYLESRHEVKHAFSTWQKSIDVLGFKHKTDLREGLEDMWSWVLDKHTTTGIPGRVVWDRYELNRGMYDFWKPENLKLPDSRTIKRRPRVMFG